MSEAIITVENLSKKYRLGEIGATSLREAAERLWQSAKRKLSLAETAEFAERAEEKRRPDLPRDAESQSALLLPRKHGSKGKSGQSGNEASFTELATQQFSEDKKSQRSPPALSAAEGRTLRETNPDDLWALKDVSFEVKRGEVLGIIGRNGAGKSTLLKILSRITEPTSGRAIMRGRVGSLLEVGTGFHPELSGRENIFLSGAILGMKKREIAAKFDEIVAFSEVEKFIDTPVKRYSSGMYVRLAFAVAAHLDPEILLVDEVLAVGDASFQKKCLGKMGSVAKNEGRTIVFVSHNMTAVQTLCDRCFWLNKGSVVMEEDVHHVVARYLQANSKECHVKKWDNAQLAPGDHRVRLMEVRVAPVNPDESPITVQTSLSLSVTFRNHEPDSLLNISAVINSLDGTCIFNTGSNARVFKEGIVTGAFKIPGNFLNDGAYTVRVLVVKDTVLCPIDERDTVIFEVHDVERAGMWYGKWIGAVRPHFDWSVEFHEDKLPILP